jgi:hypothetical protein
VEVIYRHTQIAWAILIPVDISFIFLIYLFATEGDPAFLLTLLLLAVISALFFALTVTVTDEEVEIKFGVGLVRKRVRLNDVFLVEPHRTRFWEGWGIRGTGEARIYNVSGFDAVSLTLSTGTKIIIGTDDQTRLINAIKSRQG